ncbi:MAG: FAD-dependent oxidoreductase [Bacteroidetes bacterium]|nr:FAD-dependent oxidoreductase [Bacteroidota bacterium]
MGSIIIIGAGASGLMAARKLLEGGYRVVVLEAEEEPGGRIRAERLGEGGAEFIHGDLPLSLALAKEAGVNLLPVRGQMMRLQKGESLGKSAGQEFLGDDWEELMKKMEELAEDEPIADFMERHFAGERYKGLRSSVRRFAEGYDLADIHRVSTKALYNEWAREGEDEEYRPVGGYRLLIDYLAGECRRLGGVFYFSSPVERVEWGKGRVRCVTKKDIFEAERLLVTASLGVLQASPEVLVFSPAITAHREAALRLGYGSIIKILAKFNEPFWDKWRGAGQTLFIISEEAVPTWWTHTEKGNCLLTGWLAGENMRVFQGLDEEVRVLRCLESIAAIFSMEVSALRTLLQDIQILDWEEAPHIRGGYSYDTVGAEDVRAVLMEPVEGTIWFAGEAFYEGIAPGTVEAAFTSGYEVADKIIARS